MNRRLQGGCQVPIAGFATIDNQILTLNALVGSIDGQQIIHQQGSNTRLISG
jgi:hydroxymethylbilane synthase